MPAARSAATPIADPVEIEREIANPFTGHRVPIILAWAESDSNPSEVGPSTYDRDLQGMRQGGSFHSQSPFLPGRTVGSIHNVGCKARISRLKTASCRLLNLYFVENRVN
jgi:hypothetical protein